METGILAFTAVFGPFIAVFAAYMLSRQENKRQEAARVFRRTMENAQNYRHAFLDTHQYKDEWAMNQVRYVEAATKRELGKEVPQEVISRALRKYETADERYTRAFRELRSLDAMLNADVLSLGLLFDRQSEPCGRAIRDLIAMAEVFQCEQVPKFDKCQERLNELIQKIGKELRPLYESLRRCDQPDTY